MKGFGFPFGSNRQSYNNNNNSKADTSKDKVQLMQSLKKTQLLWNEQSIQESLACLKKAIVLLQFIIINESIQSVKDAYQGKQKQLKNRYCQRKKYFQDQQQIKGKNADKNMKNKFVYQKQVEIMFSQKKKNVNWESIFGYQKIKNSLKEYILMPLKFPQIFTGKIQPWRGILFYGPHGCGKTILVNACANQADINLFQISLSDLKCKYEEGSQWQIKKMFNQAIIKRPSIIFIKQLDQLCSKSKDQQNKFSKLIKTVFLAQMSKMGKSQNSVFILSSSNQPWILDADIRKMFQRKIYIQLPQYHVRVQMLKNQMKNNVHSLIQNDFHYFAKATQTFNGQDIVRLVKDVLFQPVRRLQSAKKFKKINNRYVPCRQGQQGQNHSWLDFKKEELDIGLVDKQDFMVALKRSKPSIDKMTIAKYQEFTKAFGSQL